MNEDNTTHVLHRIRSSYPQLSEKEQLIADYILKHPESIVHSTINQIADELMIADATVFRFCKRLDFKGYQALKIALASELVHPIQDIHEEINETDSEMEILAKVFQANMNAVQFTKEIQESAGFRQVLDHILNADQLHFYGNGGSGITAQDGLHKFIRTGIPCFAYTDTHMQLMAASQLTEKDVVFFISHTGANNDLLEVVETAKENGAVTIGITNLAKSPLSKQVDVCLYTASEETDYRSEALSSRIAELSLLDALYVNYSVKTKDKTQQAVNKMRKAISKRRV
ncbi:MurR/RpiR family transcriptional regulator [Salibacterium halotolerans]|uniref:DNA-binding transcriptional regulator, MurR/RpiR family, contains HTH and SIS domains n=1 Tax=Salibacterium halotolerans TaxID=1884432 RepID=A0A1I5TPY0_9BACI|nr:MurR/RpiR family transcriptional regulator [Salibacterium halotolerans]SFP84416.1 DNA-binding transcriptional regulator, MurR/RpiR family, contains HTH and SIS domains [Salibacterium halotolerans]